MKKWQKILATFIEMGTMAKKTCPMAKIENFMKSGIWRWPPNPYQKLAKTCFHF
jgi:hypothetical protein